MKRFWFGLAITLAAVVPALPTEAAVPTAQKQTLMLVRTTSGPASFTLIVEAALSDQNRRAFNGVVSARVESGRVVRASSLGGQAFYWDYGVRAKTPTQTVEVCQPLGGCIVNRTLAYNSITSSRDRGGPDLDNRLYVVIEGPADVKFKASGWELRRVPLTYRYVEAADAQATGVFTGSDIVEVFDAASLTGGATGSIATGTPPCSSATTGPVGVGVVPRGVGTATLTGGPTPLSVTCPENVGRPHLTGVASGRTRWDFRGPVVGDAAGVNVPLFVLDVPREP